MGQINKVRLQFDLNIKMQKIISQIPELNPFLTRIPINQHFQAVKHLIRLGLQTTQNYTCTQNGSDQSIMRRQLDIIKENIEELNNMVRQQPYNYCRCCQSNKEKIFQTQPENINKNQSKKGFGELVTFQKKNEQKPVRDGYQVVTLNYSNSQSTNPFAKNKSLIVRRNLDDTGAKQALTFPVQMLAQKPPKIKRKSQSFRKHIYQEQVNKQALEKIKEERGQSLDKLRRDRTVSDYSKATSKIKSLIEKDRIRYTQTKRKHQFQQGYNKYEYSDENQMEESSMHEEEAKAYQARLQRPHSQTNTYEKDLQSGFKPSSSKNSKKASSKKQLELSQREISSKLEGSLRGLKQQNQSGSSKQRYKNERSHQLYRSGEQNKEQQDDVISNSSSFSQFSMDGSRRKQVGKISRRSQND